MIDRKSVVSSPLVILYDLSYYCN